MASLECAREGTDGREGTCTAAEARFAERTDWLGPDPTRCFDSSIAQSTWLLLSSDLVAYCGFVSGISSDCSSCCWPICCSSHFAFFPSRCSEAEEEEGEHLLGGGEWVGGGG